MPLTVPANIHTSTPIYRMVHIDNLRTVLTRGALHAPSCAPQDGLPYTSIHAAQTQVDRGGKAVPCGVGGTIRDYIGFYFGPKSPMLLRLKTGSNVQQVPQQNIVYLVSTAQAIAAANLGFVFTDRHSLTSVALFKDRLVDLQMVSFPAAYADWWHNTADQPDRQEKKQAEFLVYNSMPWSLVHEIGVYNDEAQQRVNQILAGFPNVHHPTINLQPAWYY